MKVYCYMSHSSVGCYYLGMNINYLSSLTLVNNNIIFDNVSPDCLSCIMFVEHL